MDGRQGSAGFVGRDGPRGRISAALDDTLTGRSRLVLVSGEAGIGKTALLAEATAAAADRAAAAWGTCWDAERAPGYWPWTQVLRALPVSEPDESPSDGDRADLARLMPELLESGAGPRQEQDEERARFRLFDAIARRLERAARARPLVIVLDDLQWADDSSLALLAFVVRAHRPAPLLIIGAYRHDELRAEAAEVIQTISTKAENVRLQGLSGREVREVLAQTGDDLAARWGDDVHRRTGGHPFLVRELSHVLAAEDAPEVVPHAARDLIAGRIARLSPTGRRLLDAAAVAGNELLPDVLADMLTLPPATVATEIAGAVRAGILVGGEDHGRARFAHDLYRETIYAELPVPVRLNLHQAVGSALERRSAGGRDVFPGEIARHFARAAAVDGSDRAIRWALRAAAADRARLAFAEAAAQLTRIRIALDEAGVDVGAAALTELLVAQADAESRAGDAERAREILREALTQARRLDDAAPLAAVALGLQRLGARFAMPRDEVVAVLDEARLAVEGRAPALEAQVTASLARELHHSVPKDRARAQPLSERAVAIAREVDDAGTLAACLLARHDVLWAPGLGTERVGIAREIVSLAERAGDAERRSEGHLLTANALLETGSPAFRTELDAFLRLEDELGQPRHDYYALTRRAAIALLDGTLDEGERLVHEAAALGERIGEPDAGNVRMSQLLEVARARGEAALLRSTAEKAIAWWTGVPSHAYAVAAGFLADAGDLEAARRALDTVLELGTWREDRSYLWSVFVGGLTTAASRLDDRDLSRQLLDELVPLADACAVNGAVVCFMGSLAHWAGVAAKTLGRTDEARDLLHRALQGHEALGARAWEAATCAELAELDGGGDFRERAAALADELGLVGVADRMSATAPTSPSDAPDAVLRRDGDVWHVAYQGESARLRDAKGLHDLAVLLARPGQDVGALDLAESAMRGDESSSPVLDARARADYRRRLTELDEDLGEAREHSDLGQIERVEAERDALLDELRRATGPAGRDRGLGPRTAERARKAVSARLRDTIRRIEEPLPELGRHLDRSIVTGAYCRYQPVEPLSWDLGPG